MSGVLQKLGKLSLILLTHVAASSTPLAQRSPATGHWVSTWATSLELAPSEMEKPSVPASVVPPDFSKLKAPGLPVPASLEDQTVRMIAHVSIGGSRLRVQLSNAMGKNPVTISAVRIAPRVAGSTVDAAKGRLLTFGGTASVTIPPGALLASDAVEFPLKAASDLAVSLYLQRSSGAPTAHIIGLHTGYVSKGDTTASAMLEHPDQISSYLWLSGIDVEEQPEAFAVVALGLDHRWLQDDDGS